MKASEKYIKIFGSISHLSEEIPWTTGVSNMVETLVWGTRHVLGVSKKDYWKQIVDWSCSNEMKDLSTIEIQQIIEKKLNALLITTEQFSRYSKTSTGICSAREALRRIKYFSEDYLNKEFDIFLNLSSDNYLDNLYQQFVSFNKGHKWTTHGNSGLIENSTNLKAMAMDNLAYNKNENLLVANELKLNGKKNPDQILKYCLMCNHLEKTGFINLDSKFLLLFVSGKKENYDLKIELEKEIEYCKKKGRNDLITTEILTKAENISLNNLSWREMSKFNESFSNNLSDNAQVEKKLLSGFNASLSEKSFNQKI